MSRESDCQRIGRSVGLAAGALWVSFCCFVAQQAVADDSAPAARFHARVETILETYCYACHGYGEHKGGHAFDGFKSDKELVGDTKLWLAVLKNVRAGLMPPHAEAQPTDVER